MRVMVLMKATDASEQGLAPTPTPTPETLDAFGAMDAFTEQPNKAGVLVAGAGLKPGAQGKRIAIDGPFAEARELVAGFSIREVKDMDEAAARATRSPALSGRSEIELRPFYETSDLADFVTPEELANPRDGERGRLGVA